MPIIHFEPDERHEPHLEINRQAIVYHLIRGVFMGAGVPLDELKQQTDQIYSRLHNEEQLGGHNND